MVKERIKELRKALNLTQQEFADRLGISRGNVATYESRDGNPGASVISLICLSFNVNEQWLRTGEGEMFVRRSRRDEIDSAVERLMSGEAAQFKQRLVIALSSLDEKQWTMIAKKLREIVNGSTYESAVPDIEAETRAEAEEYYRQRLIEKKAEAAALVSSREKDA